MASPLVGVIMGSKSDWETMRLSAEMLRDFDIPHECRIVSAHRTPDWMNEYAATAQERPIPRGLQHMIGVEKSAVTPTKRAPDEK